MKIQKTAILLGAALAIAFIFYEQSQQPVSDAVLGPYADAPDCKSEVLNRNSFNHFSYQGANVAIYSDQDGRPGDLIIEGESVLIEVAPDPQAPVYAPLDIRAIVGPGVYWVCWIPSKQS